MMQLINKSVFKILNALLAITVATANASVNDDLGFTDLQTLLGPANVPTGAGISVMQIEAGTNFFPDITNAELLGKTIVDLSAVPSPAPSVHATGVGGRFYGLTQSMTPAIDNIGVYSANAFLFEFLNFNTPILAAPSISESRIGNHSWVGNGFTDNGGTPVPTATSDALRRLDWLIGHDEFTQITAPDNATTGDRPLMTTAYNVITVGLTSAMHLTSVSDLDGVYVPGRVAIHLVSPQVFTSSAAPNGASAAALLVSAAQANPLWSAGNTTNRDGALIYNAERSETIKAALMAGALRLTLNSVSLGDVAGYRTVGNQTDNGLDWRYGAGQININNSYAIIASGEKASNQDAGAGPYGYTGYDYDPAFGGSSGSNSIAEYDLGTAAPNQFFAASLVWNLDVTGPSGPSAFNSNASLDNLDLYLVDITGGANTIVASSVSTIDNTENIWFETVAGREYRLRVTRPGSNFNWDYAIAWRAHPFGDNDGDGSFDHLDTDPLDPCLPLIFVSTCLQDSDNDGLTDYMEGETIDTDVDGIADYLESNITDDDGDGLFNHQDSAVFDSDGDGVVDQLDIWNNDPCLPDSSMCDVEIPILPLLGQYGLALLLASFALLARRTRFYH